jgi:lipocalin
LSRTPEMDDEVKRKLVDRARELGFEVENLLFIAH